MKKTISVPVCRRSLTILDNIVYSSWTDKKETKHPLELSLLFKNGNLERKLIMNNAMDHEDLLQPQPLILCLTGGGYTHCERTRILPELQFLAESGYTIASIDYRLSSQAGFPAPLEDAIQAVHYLLQGKECRIDPERIGILGRSAGGHAALLLGMNCSQAIAQSLKPNFKFQAVCSMYGIGDILTAADYEIQSHYFSKADQYPETLFGRFLQAGTEEEFLQKARMASPINWLNSNMGSILLLHGNQDPIIPCQASEKLYEKACVQKLDSYIDFRIIEGAGHGSAEFFQPEIQELILKHFDKNLKR